MKSAGYGSLPQATAIKLPAADAVAVYTAVVIDHFDRPRNAGRLESAADVIEGSAGRRADGVEFHFTARVARDVVDVVRVQTFGCPHSVAAASWLSERLIGMTRTQLQQWQWREAAQALDVPTEKRGRLLVLEDAVRALARNWTPGTCSRSEA